MIVGKRVEHKKRLVVAVAAVIHRRTGNYAKTYRTLRLCLSKTFAPRITERWLRVRLKRLGFGFSKRHKGETYNAGEWVVSRLANATYKTYKEMGIFGEVVIYSHHHANGAAFETQDAICYGCGAKVPDGLVAVDKLIQLRRKI